MHGLETLKALNRNPKLAAKGLNCTISLGRPKALQGKSALIEGPRKDAPERGSGKEAPEGQGSKDGGHRRGSERLSSVECVAREDLEEVA